MPYINKDIRDPLTPKTKYDAGSPGALNFQITKLVNDYVKLTGLSYWAINDILGALEGAKLEFYRRIVVPYEDQKIKENGDVYTI